MTCKHKLHVDISLLFVTIHKVLLVRYIFPNFFFFFVNFFLGVFVFFSSLEMH